MNVDDDVFRIFSALDSQNQGFINKNDFLEKMLQFLSSSNDSHDNNIIQIEQLMESYSKIGLDEFKEIYLEIQRLNVLFERENTHMEGADKRPESPLSSSSSDIDDVHQTKDIWIKQEKSSSSPVRSVESIKSDGLLSSPGSARKHGRELMNNSRSKFLKIINSPLIMDSSNCTDLDTLEHNNKMETEIESLLITNEKMKEEIMDLKNEISEENRRYQNEKDQNKVAIEKIYLLESMIHDNELRHKTDIKTISEEYKSKLQSMEIAFAEAEDQFHSKYHEMEKQISLMKNEYKNLLLSCQAKDSENRDLQRECRILQTQKNETEMILMEYKQVSSKQVTELQAERDQLELTNIKINTELQTIKHISPAKSPAKRSPAIESHATLRQRAKSLIESPIKSDERYFAQPTAIEYQNIKLRPDSIESETSRLVQMLTRENRNLVERIAHLETVGFYQRQKLEAANCLSLADEMEQLNLEELKNALTVERETVRTLQNYMESLTNKLLIAGYIDVFQLS